MREEVPCDIQHPKMKLVMFHHHRVDPQFSLVMVNGCILNKDIRTQAHSRSQVNSNIQPLTKDAGKLSATCITPESI